MPADPKRLDKGLVQVSKALRTTADKANERAVRDVARQHLELIQYYRGTLDADTASMLSDFDDSRFRKMNDLAERKRWRALLVDSHALIMALPGDPPSLPKKPPRPPWQRKKPPRPQWQRKA